VADTRCPFTRREPVTVRRARHPTSTFEAHLTVEMAEGTTTAQSLVLHRAWGEHKDAPSSPGRGR
jgi:hypothetical protein